MPTISQSRVTAGTGSVVFAPASSTGSTTGKSTVSTSIAITTDNRATIAPPPVGIVAPSFSIVGTWEADQQIIAIPQFNMVFDGVQIVGSSDSYLQIFHYSEGTSD